MRNKNVKSYFDAFDLNAHIETGLIGEVIKSSNAKIAVGDIVRTFRPLQQYWNITPEMLDITNPVTGLPLIERLAGFLRALGMPSITAYPSFYKIGRPKKGEVIFISAASGSVGSLVGQLAKHQDLTVIGSVGDDDKLKYIINELSFDSGFNYKKESPKDALARLAPNGIAIYFENVGGETLQAALDALKTHGRIIVCGIISQYNLPHREQCRLAGTKTIFGRRIKIQGLIQSDPDFRPKWGKEHIEKVSRWILNNSFKTRSHIIEGMDNAIEGLLGFSRGENFRKAVLRL
jgi:NADPH-dependent curcumin reductase CurA